MEKIKISFCRTDASGNIFDIVSRVSAELKKAGMAAEAKTAANRVWQAGSYDEALNILREYVDFDEAE